jgi:ribosomal protein S18 acetylase RimI-like enzyme
MPSSGSSRSLTADRPADDRRASLELFCENQRAYYEFVGRSPLIETREDGEIRWISSGSSSFFNSVVETKSTALRVDLLIEEAVAYFTGRGVRRFAWRVQASDRPRDLRTRLLTRGFDEIEVGPMMALDTDRLDDRSDSGAVFVRRVEDAGTAADWASVVVPAFGLPLDRCDFHAAWLRSLGYEGAARSYVGYAGEAPVTAVQIFLDRRSAGVYWLATHPSARMEGHATRIARAALADARRVGAKKAVLHANEPAISLYRRIGFRECGSVKRYLWRKDRV